MQIKKNYFYLDRNRNLVRIVSDKLSPLELFVALRYPETPNSKYLFFIRADGKPLKEENGELILNVTCPLCNGRGQFLHKVDVDTAERRVCHVCTGTGYRI